MTRCAYGYCCGCAGDVAGGVFAVGAVGVERGSKYQTRTRARTTAAAIMSNLFVSIGSARFSLAHHVSAPWGSGTSQTLRANKHHMAVRPEEQAKARYAVVTADAPSP